ncbi:hypothetical protein PMY38_06385 [Clostridium tertium]|uniref:RNA dependent RNA polymerase n=1 Tax=Clostridium tertium TaxID=1559 RepID=UPI00189CB5C0|nr:hypothetical protein [Clostridium tertium]MDB1947689.1 hypothetical protein [Clostridium tertium]MDB1956313.1 hypothetical protein [Clostridium tertium]MDB1958219.1 hypothetical protein [Clostridium tertium]MDB1961595.1 hypothetical protein [Clostridium tertium]MDB1967327.1 hypothetical protein [Clostridium tertium]
MKKLRRFEMAEVEVKVGAFGKYDIEAKEIIINENPMLLMMFEGLGLNIEEVERIDWIVKVQFSSKQEALKLKDLPLTFNGNRYYFYLSTPADMKNERAIFVREDVIGTIKQYESIVSCGWLDSLEGKTGVNVNKDVTARLSLFLSSSYHTNIKPNYLVLPEVEYKTIQSIKTFENGQLVVKEGYEHDSVFADGCGIASPALMKRVAKELKLGYEPCFLGVRSIKLALKGLLVSIDFVKYFNDMYKGDTETLRKVNGTIEAKDMYGNWIKVDNNTIIVNPSMCKWASKISLEEYEAKRPEALKNIMDALFITKASKKEPAEYKKTSYQLLCQLGLNAEDYNELTKETYNILSGVLKGDENYIYHFLGAIESEEEVEIADRLSLLLRADFDRFYRLPWVRRTLANMIERSVKELCSGKFYVKGDFKTIVNAPLGILNYAMNREINDTLKANEFWCNTEDKKVLACRFPIASFSEVGAMDFIEDSLYNRYCGHWTKELCVFNAKDIRAKILSGADFDTDTIFTSSNPLLIESIIVPKDGLHFIGTEENKGNLGEATYNWSTRTFANTAYMGNIIGEVAILNACISNQAQDLGVYVDGKNVTYKNYFKNVIPTEEQKKAFWNWFGQQQRTMNLSREIVKEVVANQFYEVEEAIYKTVEISMVAIDAPKTGILPDLDYIKDLKKNFKKPYYFKFLPEKDINEFTLNRVGESVLESYAKWSEFSNENWKGILARVEYYKNNSSWRNGDIFKELFKVSNTYDVNEVVVEEVQTIIENSFNDYNKQRKERDKKYIVMVQEYNEELGDYIETNKAMLDASGKPVIALRHNDDIRTLMTKTMCYRAERVGLEVADKYAGEEVCVALFRMMNKNIEGLQRFVFDFYFKYVQAMISIEYPEYNALVESHNENGVEILGVKYEINKKKLKEANIGDKELKRFEAKKDIQSQNIEFKFGFSKEAVVELKDYVTLSIIDNADIYVFASTGERVGKVYVSGATNGVNLYALAGAKLLLQEVKETAKSYNVRIKGIEA